MRRYWRFVVPAVIVIGVLVALLVNLTSNLVYFNTPTELMARTDLPTPRLRLGGQVEAGTITESADGVRFILTDGREGVEVLHQGAPPQLFADGIGVVVEGTWDGHEFHSDNMLIKHDEQYRTEDGEVYDRTEHELSDP
jgi:cytochrome c-type biogenesis protein CcmE